MIEYQDIADERDNGCASSLFALKQQAEYEIS